MNRFLPTLLRLLFVAVVSTGIVVALNASEISRVTSPVKEVTPETFTGIKDFGARQVIKITGTPDLLNAVSLEGRNDDVAIYYYAPLKEYGTNFVVRIKKTKLNSTVQTFTGELIGLTQTEFEARIRTALNKPVTLSDEQRAELDAQTINDLNEQTQNNFTSATFIVQDGQVPDPGVTFGNVTFWSTVLFVALSTLLLRRVFRSLYR